MTSRYGACVALLALAAGAARLALALRVGVPSNDGAIYLWASEALAAGDLAAPWTTVFHAGTAHAIAPFVASGLDAYPAAACAMALASALAVLAMGDVLRGFGAGAWRLLVLGCFAFGFSFTRLPADVYSESFAIPCVLAALGLALRGRHLASSGAAVLGYAFRPEAILALCAPLLLTRGGWRARGAVAALGFAGVLAYAAAQAAMTGSAAATPKLAFMLPLGPLGAALDGDFAAAAGQLARNLARLPGAMLGGLDYALFFVALFALLGVRRGRPRFARMAACWMGLHVLALLAFQVKPRFFLMLAPLVYPLALAALSDPRAGAARALARACVALALAAALVRVGKDFVDPPRQEKRVELVVGRECASRFGAGAVLSPLPRVMWAAGARPLPPWPWTLEELFALPRAREDALRVVVLRAGAEGRAFMRERARFERAEGRGDRLDVYVRR